MSELASEGLVPGRDCGSCSLCCKVLKIDWLAAPKPGGKWCPHCAPGRGCGIWTNRPSGCATYFCEWRRLPQLGDEWRPDRAGFLISRPDPARPYEIVVDPGRANSWRQEPYYTQLKNAAASAIANRQALVVQVGGRQWILLPDGDQPVPPGKENHDFRLVQESPLFGGKWNVIWPD